VGWAKTVRIVAATSCCAALPRTWPAHASRACGAADPQRFAFYCAAEVAIYYAPTAFAEHRLRIGDFAPIVVMAHEWGHHVQLLLGMVPRPGNALELQADCLAGAYARDAERRGLLNPGDITEAVAIAATMGDPLGLPQDAPGAHGIDDDRITAFMRGYLDGVPGCGPTLSASPASPDRSPSSPPQSREHPDPSLGE
jgi:predicted metalloprotease